MSECCCHCCECGHAEGAAVAERVSAFRISAMDCPVEEGLIRKRLEGMSGVLDLGFNLMNRVLTVRHTLPSEEDIVAALESVGMPPDPPDGGAGVARFHVPDMDCPVEEGLIRKKLEGMPGMLGMECNFMDRILTVRHDASALEAITKALESLGMGARLMDRDGRGGAHAHAHDHGHDHGHAHDHAHGQAGHGAGGIAWGRIIAAGVLAALAEACDLACEWNAVAPDAPLRDVLEILPLILSVAAIALCGLTTYRKGWLAVSCRTLNMNALMSVAVTGAVCIGSYAEAAMVMALFNLSEALESRTLARARDALRDLLAIAPERASVALPDGTWEERDIHDVPVGSRVRVAPGERIALDGVVISGRSAVNQAPITGESMPVEKSEGDTVFAGTVNESGSFEFRTTAGAGATTLARIIRSVEEAQGSRAPIQRFVDRFAAWYTPALFSLSVLAAVLLPVLAGWEWGEAVYTSLVLLVIGCPCALVISTPVTLVGGMSAATRSGILVKGGAYLEQGRRLTCIALDKTGTITHGRPTQTDFVPLGSRDPAEIAALAAGLAARSSHPVSRALAEAAAGTALPEVEDFSALPGEGIRGAVAGRIWHLGSARLARRLGALSEEVAGKVADLERKGGSVVILVGEDGAEGLFAVADTMRETSAEAVAALKRMGVRTVMLTGDNAHVAESVAREAGVDTVRAGLLPEDKLRIVEELEAAGEVTGMTGDGINDAPALARAGVGFAMAAAGTGTAAETADVEIMDDDLRKIPRFISLSRSTHAILVENIAIALGIKALFLALALAGQATMWMAVFADVGASMIVVGNGLRAARK